MDAFDQQMEEKDWVPKTEKAMKEAQGLITPVLVWLSEHGERGVR